MFAKKSLGQHFLRSERALSSIVEAAQLSAGETVLEIGPGEGVLTEKLLAAGARIVAVEKDDALFESLAQKFSKEIETRQLEIVHGDILDFEMKEGEWKLVANIPYNITGAILEKFLSANNQPSLIVLLVQDEVAKRIVARDGKESILSVSVKAYGKPGYVEKVLAGSFVPAPKVDSAIIAIDGISKEFFNNFGEKAFFQLLKAGFSSKRKKLSSNLANLYPKENVLEAFQSLNLDKNLRAEDLELEKWQEMAKILLK